MSAGGQSSEAGGEGVFQCVGTGFTTLTTPGSAYCDVTTSIGAQLTIDGALYGWGDVASYDGSSSGSYSFSDSLNVFLVSAVPEVQSEQIFNGGTSQEVDVTSASGFDYSATPEPSTIGLLAIGLVGAGVMFRRRISA